MVDNLAVLAAPPPELIRLELEQLLLANICGPQGGEHEELAGNAAIRDYYLVGMLAPQQLAADPGEFDGQQDALAVEGPSDVEEVAPDAGPAAAPSLFPSSLGMTFGVAGVTGEIVLDARWGRYERATADSDDEDGKPRSAWRRIPAGGSAPLRLAAGEFGPVVPDAAQPEVVVKGRIRRSGDHWIVTAFLINEQPEQEQHKDAAWLFQVDLSAAHASGNAVFRQSLSAHASDDGGEARALDMAYRDEVQFAIGHGIGVHVEADPEDPRRATRVATSAVPRFEVPRTDPPTAEDEPALDDVVLDMGVLAEIPTEGLGEALRPLVVAYRDWIAQQRERIAVPAARLNGFESIAEEVLAQCERAADRIESGINALLDPEHPEAADAFRFANRAMGLQRVHTMVADRRRKSAELEAEAVLGQIDVPANRSWRPFQLAFLLLNLPSLSDPKHEERAAWPQGLVDLLWFPTGGGKTEAYLGLTAFTLAIRRLQGQVGNYDGTDGVAVLMRYTLRLLTVQQFQRAASLMCACEWIRLEAAAGGDARWGDVPFRLGLWVGYSVTPTRGTQAKQAIEEARGSAWHGGGSDPVQITFCPWCGAPVSAAKDAEYDRVRKRTLVYCGDPMGRCAFTRRHANGEGLPLITVDDEIYRFVPGMIIATADKYAQLPWQGPTRALFGRVWQRCERHGYRQHDLDEELDERASHHRR